MCEKDLAFSSWSGLLSTRLVNRLKLRGEITYVMESGSDSGHVFTVLFLQGREREGGIKPPAFFHSVA